MLLFGVDGVSGVVDIVAVVSGGIGVVGVVEAFDAPSHTHLPTPQGRRASCLVDARVNGTSMAVNLNIAVFKSSTVDTLKINGWLRSHGAGMCGAVRYSRVVAISTRCGKSSVRRQGSDEQHRQHHHNNS